MNISEINEIHNFLVKNVSEEIFGDLLTIYLTFTNFFDANIIALPVNNTQYRHKIIDFLSLTCCLNTNDLTLSPLNSVFCGNSENRIMKYHLDNYSKYELFFIELRERCRDDNVLYSIGKYNMDTTLFNGDLAKRMRCNFFTNMLGGKLLLKPVSDNKYYQICVYVIFDNIYEHLLIEYYYPYNEKSLTSIKVVFNIMIHDLNERLKLISNNFDAKYNINIIE